MHSKSQSLDDRETSCTRSSSHFQSSIYLYLKEKKQRNRSRQSLPVNQSAASNSPAVLMDVLEKKNTTDDQRFSLMIDLLYAKINVMGEHTQQLENRLKILGTTFTSFSDAYTQSPTGRQTLAVLNKLRQQIRTSIPTDRLTVLQRQLKRQVQDIKDKFSELIKSLQRKAQEDMKLLRVKLDQDRTNSELRLQSTIDALSYNNLIMSKLNRGDSDKIRTELSKYQHLRKKHQELVIENERIRTNSMLQRFSKSTQLQSKQSDEENDTAIDQAFEEDY